MVTNEHLIDSIRSAINHIEDVIVQYKLITKQTGVLNCELTKLDSDLWSFFEALEENEENYYF